MRTIIESIKSSISIDESKRLIYDILDDDGNVFTYNDLVKKHIFTKLHPMYIKDISNKLNSASADEYSIIFGDLCEDGYDVIDSSPMDGYLYGLDIVDRHDDVIFHIGIGDM